MKYEYRIDSYTYWMEEELKNQNTGKGFLDYIIDLLDWGMKNNIKIINERTGYDDNPIYILNFENEADFVAFKLAWL